MPNKKPITKFSAKFRFNNGATGSAKGTLEPDKEGDPVEQAMKIVRNTFQSSPVQFLSVNCN